MDHKTKLKEKNALKLNGAAHEEGGCERRAIERVRSSREGNNIWPVRLSIFPYEEGFGGIYALASR